MIFAFALVIAVILLVLTITFYADQEKNSAGVCLLLLIISIFIGYNSAKISYEKLQSQPFNYYPVGVIVKNGNKYIMDGIKQVDTTFTIPEGRNIVYMKYRETKDIFMGINEKTFVLNEGD